MTAFATNREIKLIINKYNEKINNFIKSKEYPAKIIDLCENYFLKQQDIFTRQLFRDKIIKYLQDINIYDNNKEMLKLINDDIKALDRIKKCSFQMNSGLLKFSTIHSFKGMQSPSIVVILNSGNTPDIPEMVYCAITRAKNNLFIFDIPNSPYKNFFTKYIF